MNTEKPKKRLRRKRRPIKEAAPVAAKDVDSLRREFAAQKRLINNIAKENKYLRDRVSNLENRSNAVDRVLNQLQSTVNSLSRIFR